MRRKAGVFSGAGMLVAALLLFIGLIHGPWAVRDDPVADASEPSAHRKTKSPLRVLMLTGSTLQLPWYGTIADSFARRLEEETGGQVVLHTDSVDAELLGDPRHASRLLELLQSRYARSGFDLVFVREDAADFLSPRNCAIFPQVPAVFTGYAGRISFPEGMANPRRAVGYVLDFAGTADIALDLFPQTRTFHILAGSGAEEQSYLARARSSLGESYRGIPVHYLTDLPHADLLARLAALPEDDVVLHVLYRQDTDDRTFVPREILVDLATASPAPMFSVWETFVGKGVLGGSVADPVRIGRVTADAALGLLRDESRNVETVEPVPMFDWEVMHRFGISDARLPEGAVVRNKPHGNLWQEHRGAALTWLAALIVLATFSVLLAVNVLRRRRAERRLLAAHDNLELQVRERTHELARTQEHYRALTENSPDVVARLDAEVRCLYINTAVEKAFGLKPEDILGRTPGEIPETIPDASADDMRQLEEGVREVLRTGADRTVMVRYQDRVLQTLLVPELAGNGRVETVLSLTRDITELLRARQDAEQRFVELEATFEALESGVIIYDGSGNITRSNRVAAKLLDFEHTDLNLPFGRRFRNYEIRDAEGEKLRPSETAIALALRGEVVRSSLVQFRHALADEGRWLLCSAAPIEVDGTFLGAVLSLTEVTLLKQLQNEILAAKEEAEQANRAKSVFLANMSHEIRTPLNGVLGMTQLARLSTEDPQLLEYLELILSSGNHLLNIVNDILDLAKIEAGAATLEARVMDPETLLRDLVEIYRPQAREKGLEIALRVEGDPPGLVLGDAGRLRQVLANLVSNAVKFTDKGRVEVRLNITETPGGWSRLRFEVEDTGIGIPEGQQQRVFESFHQVDATLHRKHGGTGLGLAITSNLVRMMEGTLSLTSREGRGSTFSVELILPRVAAEENESGERKIPEPEPSTEAKSLSILVVEDDPVNEQVTLGFLAKDGHRALVARDGAGALDMLANHRFDLALVDIRLPDMSGLEIAERLRAGRVAGADPKLPLVALTAYARKEDRMNFLSAGIDAFISKPVEPEELAASMSAVLEARGRDASA